MSAAVGAALKKVLVAILTEPKVLKNILFAILVVVVAMILPTVFLVSIFSGDFEVDTASLQQYVEDNLSAADIVFLTNVENTMDGAGQYPISMGGINLKRNIVRFKKGVAATESIGFVNMSGRSLKFDCDRALLPDCLRFYAEPVRPMKEGVIKISYDPSVPVNADELVILLQGLGLPPSKSSIKVIME